MRQLYHIPFCSFCRKIRMSLREKGLPFELKAVDPWQKTLDFLCLNPSGDVPVLMEGNGKVICGGYAIGEYLEEQYSDLSLLGRSSPTRAEVRRLVDWFDQKFYREVTHDIVYEKVFKRLANSGSPDSCRIRSGKDHILHHLDYIGYLASERYFLAGEHLSMADLAAASHLSVLDYLGDVPWHYNAAAQQWYALIKSRPSLRAILTDRISGMVPPKHYEDPDF